MRAWSECTGAAGIRGSSVRASGVQRRVFHQVGDHDDVLRRCATTPCAARRGHQVTRLCNPASATSRIVAGDLVCVLGGGVQRLAGCEHPTPALEDGIGAVGVLTDVARRGPVVRRRCRTATSVGRARGHGCGSKSSALVYISLAPRKRIRTTTEG